MVRRVGEIRWVVCASPDYLTRHGEPRTPADLSDHDCIAFEELQRYREWSFASEGQRPALGYPPLFGQYSGRRDCWGCRRARSRAGDVVSSRGERR